MNIEPSKPKRLLRITEAIQRLSCGKTRFYEYVNEGQIELVKLGASSRISEEALERFMANLPTKRGRHDNPA